MSPNDVEDSSVDRMVRPRQRRRRHRRREDEAKCSEEARADWRAVKCIHRSQRVQRRKRAPRLVTVEIPLNLDGAPYHTTSTLTARKSIAARKAGPLVLRFLDHCSESSEDPSDEANLGKGPRGGSEERVGSESVTPLVNACGANDCPASPQFPAPVETSAPGSGVI